jgi:putative membrane protein
MINTIALFLVVKTVKGIEITTQGMDGFLTLAVTAMVIGVINTLIKPVILLLTLPFTILTLGLFTLVINGAMFWLAAFIVKGFVVTDFMGAVIGALFFSILTMIFGMFIPDGSRVKVRYKVFKD